ncbi:MAG: N-acetyltransferase, partial [Candidatus Limnocylindria bacterium]
PPHGLDRTVRAVHGVREVTPDPPEELEQSEDLRRNRSPEELAEIYSRVLFRDSHQGAHERRVLLRAMCKSFGNSVRVGLGVLVLHPSTFEIGDAVFLGSQTFLQGRHDGHCVIGA